MLFSTVCQFPINRAGEEENCDHCRRYPERAVEVGVAVESVEEVGAWIQSSPTSLDDFCGIDIEVLRVEVDAP